MNKIMTLEAQPLPMPGPDIKPVVAGESVSPKEIPRIAKEWQDAVTLIFDQNRDIVVGAVDPTVVALDPQVQAKSTPAEKDSERDRIAAERNQKRQAALEDAKITADLKAKHPDREPTADEIAAEKIRRQSLQQKYDDLFAVAAIPHKINQEVEQEIAKIEGSAAGVVIDEAQRQQIEATVRAKYCLDADTFVQYDSTGHKTGEIRYSNTYGFIHDQLEAVAATSVPESQPVPPEVAQAKQLVKELQLSADKKSFLGRTEKQVEEAERQADCDSVAREGLLLIAQKIEGSLGPELLSKVFTIEKGLITGVDPNKLKEVEAKLKEVKPDETIAALTPYLGAYYDEKTPPELKPRIAALLHHALPQEIQDRLATTLHKPNRFSKIIEDEIIPHIKREYHFDFDLQSDFAKNLIRDLGLAMICREKKLIAYTQGIGYDFVDDKKLNGELGKLNLSDDEIKFVMHFASEEGRIEGFLTKIFGIDPGSLERGEAWNRYVDNVLNKLVDERVAPTRRDAIGKDVKAVYEKALQHYLSDDSLDKIAKKRGFPKGFSYALMALLILAPSLQGILTIGGESGEERGRGG